MSSQSHPWPIHVNVWQNQYSIVKQNKVKIKIKTNKQQQQKNKGCQKEIIFAKGLVSYLYLKKNSKSTTWVTLSFLCCYYANEDLNKQNLLQWGKLPGAPT